MEEKEVTSVCRPSDSLFSLSHLKKTQGETDQDKLAAKGVVEDVELGKVSQKKWGTRSKHHQHWQLMNDLWGFSAGAV
jgi:hypothetical protein